MLIKFLQIWPLNNILVSLCFHLVYLYQSVCAWFSHYLDSLSFLDLWFNVFYYFNMFLKCFCLPYYSLFWIYIMHYVYARYLYCTYIHMYIYIWYCTCIHMYIHTTFTCICMYIYICAYLHTYVYMYVSVYLESSAFSTESDLLLCLFHSFNSMLQFA